MVNGGSKLVQENLRSSKQVQEITMSLVQLELENIFGKINGLEGKFVTLLLNHCSAKSK